MLSSSTKQQPRSPKPIPQPQTSQGPLEKRGLVLGETIGVGAYAKVKVARSVHTKRTVHVLSSLCRPIGVVRAKDPLCHSRNQKNSPVQVAVKIITKAKTPEDLVQKLDELLAE